VGGTTWGDGSTRRRGDGTSRFARHRRRLVRIMSAVVVTLATSAPVVLLDAAPASATGPIPTTTTLSSSANPAQFGQTITFTISVSPATASGPVTLYDGATVTTGAAFVSSGSATISNICDNGANHVCLSAGTHSLSAHYSGDFNNTYAASNSSAVSQSITAATTTTTVTSSSPSNTSTFGQSVTFTSQSGPTYATWPLGQSSAQVTFKDGSTTLGSAFVDFHNQRASFTTSTLGAGTHSITATYPGDSSTGDYAASTSAAITQTVNQASQSITFTSTAPSSAVVGGSTYNVTATASSGLAVSFSADATSAGICTVAGSTVSFVGTGTCTVDANQSGNSNYLAAPQAQQAFAVGKGSQAISFTPPASGSAGGSSTLAATGGASGNPVVFSVDGTSGAGVCNVTGTNGTTLNYTAGGTCVVDANQAGNGNYNAAPQVQRSIGVNKSNQTITYTSTAPSAAQVGGSTYNVTATASSGLTVTFTADGASSGICTVSGSTVSFVGVGTCVIDANQAGNTGYNAAPQVQQSFTVSKGDQTISFTPPASGAVGAPATLSATGGGSGNPVVFSIDASSDPGVCNVSGTNGTTLNYNAVGNCVVDANQAGNTDYNDAAQAQGSVTVGKGSQTISFTPPASGAVGGSSTLSASGGSSGSPVVFSIDGTSDAGVCNVTGPNGTSLHYTAVGNCVIDANQAGSANYNAAPQAQGSVTVGKGDQTIAFTSSAPSSAKVGGATYNVTATASSGLTVAFSADGSSAGICTVAGSTVSFVGVGTCRVNADQAGSANYNAAPQVHQSFVVAKGDQTIGFTSTAPAAAKVGGATYNVTATATSGLPVAFTADDSSTGVCTVSGSTVSFDGVGTCTVDADQPGNENYNAAPQAQQSFTVAKGDQTISFTSIAPAAAKVGGATYNVTATASSGLTVAFSADGSSAGICTVSGSTVSFVGVGTCTINADQAGDANYNAAPQAQQGFAVAKGDQTIGFTSTAPAAAKVGGATYNVTATASSGLTVAFSADGSSAGICTVAGSTVSFVGVGTCRVNADQAGSANYNAAPQVHQSFVVAKGDQTIGFTSIAPAAARVGGATYNVTATASSGLTVSFSADGSSAGICTVSGSTVSFVGVGTCTINADQPGDANYNAAPQAQQGFAVAKGDQTIGFTSTAPSAAKVGGATYNVTATASSGLTVAFSADGSSAGICTVSGSTVSFVGVGTCTINADQPGDANYNAAPQAQQSFTVAKGDQTISFTSTAPAAATAGGADYPVTADATSGLAVSFSADGSSAGICTVSGSTVSFVGVGTCTINADQAGDANYNAAPQAQQAFAVGTGDQTISFTSTAPAAAVVGGPTYHVTATASSGLTVSFSADGSSAGICTVSGSTVSFVGVGTCTINADQAGDANYNAAPQAQQGFAVGKGNQSIFFIAPASGSVGGLATLSATGGASGNPVVFTVDASSDAGACGVSGVNGKTVHYTAAGSCVIDANQAGSANYNAAPQVQRTIQVNKVNQAITFNALSDRNLAQTPFTVTATSSSGLAVTFSTTTPGVCTSGGAKGATITLLNTGTCTVKADQAGDAHYNAAPSMSRSFLVTPKSQTITFNAIADRAFNQSPFTLSATTSANLPVTFTSTTPGVCTTTGTRGTTATLVAVGTCTINADQAGNANVNPAPTVTRSFQVTVANQTITFAALPNRTLRSTHFTASARATSGLPVTFTSLTTSVCTATGPNGATITFLRTGTCTIQADQAGNANYNAAPSVSRSFQIS
jgi:Bacterial Ig-like domain (group 3)